MGRGEGTTAAAEAGAALVFPVALGTSGGAGLAARFLAASLRHWPGEPSLHVTVLASHEGIVLNP